MTVHTIWGDFESEEELIKTGARMMGISYDKAKKIREQALAQQKKEREEYERRVREKEEKEKSILGAIKRKFPDIHFKECPWCGKEPELNVSVFEKTGITRGTLPKYRFESYRVDLITCEHLDCTGHYLNGYDIDVIPEEPLMPNPKVTWVDSWEHSWEYAVRDYKKYLSDDWDRKCCVCGKKWRGWEDIDVPEVDGKQYCHECFKQFEENGHPRPDLYRDMRNLSTMYDGGPQFYTSFQKLIQIRKLNPEIIRVKKKDTGKDMMASSRLTGDIRGERYEIFEKYFIAYVWRPKDLDEVKKYMVSKDD